MNRTGHAALAIVAPICASLGVDVEELAGEGRPTRCAFVVVARTQSVGALRARGWSVAEIARASIDAALVQQHIARLKSLVDKLPKKQRGRLEKAVKDLEKQSRGRLSESERGQLLLRAARLEQSL